jgi:hypothetical protein
MHPPIQRISSCLTSMWVVEPVVRYQSGDEDCECGGYMYVGMCVCAVSTDVHASQYSSIRRLSRRGRFTPSLVLP